MIVDKELKSLFDQLIHNNRAEIDLSGGKITVRLRDKKGGISLSTPVYFGGNYIPKSVRASLHYHPPFSSRAHLTTKFKIDETKFQILLVHDNDLRSLTKDDFILLIEDFNWLAEQWRTFFDDHDKKDLVHARVV